MFIVPYEDKTMRHTHTIYVHIRDKPMDKPKEEPKKVEEVTEKNYNHEWNSYKTYEYNKGRSTEGHKNEHKLTHDHQEDKFEYGKYKNEHEDHEHKFNNYNNNYDHKDSNHDHGLVHSYSHNHGHEDRYKHDHGDWNSGHKHNNDWSNEKSRDSYSDGNDQGGHIYDSHVKLGNSHGKEKDKPVKEHRKSENEPKENSVVGDKHNHNHGGERHEWHTYSDVMDHHGNHLDLGESGNQAITLAIDDNVKASKNINKSGNHVHWNHSGGTNREHKNHDHGKEGALKHSHYDSGQRSWRHKYYY